MTGNYHIETDLEVVVRAAEVSERVTQGDAVESAAKCRGTWFDGFSKMTARQRWEDYRRYHVADLTYKEPLKAGPSEPGGGGKSRVPKKPAKKMPEYMKILGM